MLKLTPLIMPTFNATALKSLDPDILRRLDAEGIEPQSYMGFIGLLLSFLKVKNIRKGIVEQRHLGQHLMFSVLIDCDVETYNDILRRALLRVIGTQTNANMQVIASGNLPEWHAAVLSLCSLTSEKHARELGNQLLLLFEGSGMHSLFNDVRKRMIDDETFILENKCKL